MIPLDEDEYKKQQHEQPLTLENDVARLLKHYAYARTPSTILDAVVRRFELNDTATIEKAANIIGVMYESRHRSVFHPWTGMLMKTSFQTVADANCLAEEERAEEERAEEERAGNEHVADRAEPEELPVGKVPMSKSTAVDGSKKRPRCHHPPLGVHRPASPVFAVDLMHLRGWWIVKQGPNMIGKVHVKNNIVTLYDLGKNKMQDYTLSLTKNTVELQSKDNEKEGNVWECTYSPLNISWTSSRTQDCYCWTRKAVSKGGPKEMRK